ncbi:hypothetical protein CAE01nite_26850 [Cellulomonas aerilata]|uniref:Uncharacterized protein n=1 Tax=Cellulomonas aerilata TaxID=515326 RepID=A0A512DFG4_9CELL|nr:hypothetical protein CAE01nite_26850 [Cellulomonas aerilata]
MCLALLGLWFWDYWTTDPSDRSPRFGPGKILVIFPAAVIFWTLGLVMETGKRDQARRRKRRLTHGN